MYRNIRVSKKNWRSPLREVSRSFIPIITHDHHSIPSFPYFRGQGLDSDLPQVLSRWKVVTFLEGAKVPISRRVGGWMDPQGDEWNRLNGSGPFLSGLNLDVRRCSNTECESRKNSTTVLTFPEFHDHDIVVLTIGIPNKVLEDFELDNILGA